MKTLLLILLPVLSLAQIDTNNLIKRSREIRNQTKPGGNTKEMVGSLFEDLSRQVLLMDKLQHKLDSLLSIQSLTTSDPIPPKILKTLVTGRVKPTYHDELGNEL